MSHPADHSQQTATSHWCAQLADADATMRLGSRLAAAIEPGMRLYFRGELGSGKSTLIRGLLRGLGVRTRVKSPSYSLVEVYVVSRLDLYHFDFYRLLKSSEFAEAGLADYFEGAGVCLVEWPERAEDRLPPPDADFTLVYRDGGREVRARAFSAAGERCLALCRDV